MHPPIVRAITAILGLAFTVSSSACDVQSLTVVRSPIGTTISDASADDLFLRMSSIIAFSQYDTDFACNQDGGTIPRWFERVDPVSVNPALTSFLASNEDVSNALQMPGWIKVVNTIMVCGALRSNIIACSDRGFPSFVVIDGVGDPSVLSGAAWAHEHGHPVGLRHRASFSNRILMDEFVTPTNTEINILECQSYMRSVDPFNGLPNPPPGPVQAGALRGETTAPPPDIPIDEFVRRPYMHGLPVVDAAHYSSEDVTVLIKMLHDPDEAAHRGRIAGALGMIGDSRAARELATMVLNARSGSTGWQHARHIASALIGLGYLSNRNVDEATQFLLDTSEPSFWRMQDTELKNLFWSGSVLALGLSAHPEAWNKLESLDATEARPQMRAMLRQAKSAHEEIRAVGLMVYDQR